MKLSPEGLIELRRKRTAAIDEAKTNCEYFFVLYKYGIPTLEERIGSVCSSVIKVGEGGESKDLGSKVSEAQAEIEKDESHIKRYTQYFEKLPEGVRPYVMGIYMDGIRPSDYKNGRTADGIPIENIYRILSDAYLELACLDPNINYTKRNEFVFENNTKKKRIGDVDIKMYMIALMQDLHIKSIQLWGNEAGDTLTEFSALLDEELLDVYQTISLLPKKDQEILKYYIRFKEVKTNSSWGYALFERALYSLAYLSKSINYILVQYANDLQLCRARSISYDRKIVKTKFAQEKQNIGLNKHGQVSMFQ